MCNISFLFLYKDDEMLKLLKEKEIKQCSKIADGEYFFFYINLE